MSDTQIDIDRAYAHGYGKGEAWPFGPELNEASLRQALIKFQRLKMEEAQQTPDQELRDILAHNLPDRTVRVIVYPPELGYWKVQAYNVNASATVTITDRALMRAAQNAQWTRPEHALAVWVLEAILRTPHGESRV